MNPEWCDSINRILISLEKRIAKLEQLDLRFDKPKKKKRKKKK